MSSYDVVIIGGGPGGYNAAIRAGQLGLSVACVEGRETLGGTCLNVGCIPSKALLHASELYEAAAGDAFARLGIEVKPTLNLAQMQKQKNESVLALTKGIEFLFRKYKAEWIKGWGRIAGPGKVIVTDHQGQETELLAKDIVIATGSEPTPLPGVEIDNKRVLDSTGALALAQVPKHLVVIGAGVIGLELGSVWRRLGAQVTVVEFLDHVAHGTDLEAGKTLHRSLSRQGMAFKLNSKVTSAVSSEHGVTLTVEPASGGESETIEADYVLVSIGRRPVTKGLGLETIGLEVNKRGVLENEGHRTSVPNVWVIGDVTSGAMLAHKAEDEASVCLERIAGKAGEVNYNLIPNVIYTQPELASVGKTEEQLKSEGRAYKVGKFPFSANSRAKVNHETEGFAKVLADEHTDEVLGVHLVGPSVSEMIAEYCVAMEFSASSEDIALTSHPHPTRSEALRQAAMSVTGQPTQS
ncbi:dihydrolipoyl dehydrogenase [Pseudomonas floridensis]|uniref:Dihydrolipoyl dehydrogenase n=1 Tax=Pseudomonas floridensis TaxID=1958950 RepID=A0A1X0N9C8_9PSED|nr:dihydrolipoyl dehydrogenase [Pseudomonas floridensis]ORC60575.1 dihydrolipoyl dehydrogenase [Pseudomonas floridensis]